MFVIIQKGAQTAYHRLFATVEDARKAIGKSHSVAEWTIYKLAPVATLKRSDEVKEIPA